MVWRLAMEPRSVSARVFVLVLLMAFVSVLVMASVMGLVESCSSGQHTKRVPQSLTLPVPVGHDAVTSFSMDLLLGYFPRPILHRLILPQESFSTVV